MPEVPAISDQNHETACCIAGGGPAGMMLGFLLARAGVDVLVLEKHGDFLRDFLNFVVEHASRLSTFHLKMQAEVTDLIEQDGRVVGVRAKTAEGNLDVRSTLTVGADGRHSTVRRQAGLPVEDIGAPIDVLWMRVSRHSADPHHL